MLYKLNFPKEPLSHLSLPEGSALFIRHMSQLLFFRYKCHKIYTIVATIVWVHKMIGSMKWWVDVSHGD